MSPGIVVTAVFKLQPVAPARTPTPRPNGTVGGPSLISVTLTVPACGTVNTRNAAPWAVIMLAKVSVVGEVVVGAAGVVVPLLPHAEPSSVKATAARMALGHRRDTP